MTRLERLRRELVALAESLVCPRCAGNGFVPGNGNGLDPECTACCGNGTHPLAQSLRAIAWSLLPREERYREPEHAGGPLTSGMVDVNRAADDLAKIASQPGMYHTVLQTDIGIIARDLRASVVQARPGECGSWWCDRACGRDEPDRAVCRALALFYEGKGR